MSDLYDMSTGQMGNFIFHPVLVDSDASPVPRESTASHVACMRLVVITMSSSCV